MKPSRQGLLNSAGKRFAPVLANLSRVSAGRTILSLTEAYLAILQGKGSGAGWDLAGEIKGAAGCLDVANPILFDVGANTGDWSRMMYDALKGRCTIYQFEPSRECWNVIVANQRPGMIPINAAIGAQAGRQILFSPGPKSRVASLYPRRDSEFRSWRYQSEDVDVLTIDDVMREKRIERIDFLKLDVEGAELDALHGAEHSLKNGNIKSLTFEFGSGNINSRTYFLDFWEMLNPLGYEFHRIIPGGATVPVGEYYEDLEYFRGVSNYICVGPNPF